VSIQTYFLTSGDQVGPFPYAPHTPQGSSGAAFRFYWKIEQFRPDKKSVRLKQADRSIPASTAHHHHTTSKSASLKKEMKPSGTRSFNVPDRDLNRDPLRKKSGGLIGQNASEIAGYLA
jgi:hypothetical protein